MGDQFQPSTVLQDAELPISVRPAQLALTGIIGDVLARFREWLSPAEVAISLRAAIEAEHVRRPFGSRARTILEDIGQDDANVEA